RGKGGRVFIFQTNRPTFGPGLLDDRNYSKLLNTENERKLYSYQSNYYHKWGEKYVDEGICASMYLFPNAFADVASSSELCKLTGGEVMVYPNFTMDRDGAKFAADLEASATQTFGTNGVLRIRCSDGIRVDQHLGNFFMRNHVDIELAGIMSSTSICATFKHDEKLDEKLDAYFQVALLYTTSDGHRRIRVHNIALPCTTLVGNLFRHAEIDTTMNIIARQAMSQAKGLALKEMRKELSEECVRILLAYRTNCASGSSPSQLILPEAYKLMPLYTLSLLKSMALRESTDVNIDLRVQCMYMLSSMSVEDSVTYFYPRIVPLHDVKSDEGVADEEGIAKLPAMVRASYSRLDPSGVYAIESRKRLYIWVGAKASAALIGDLFGTASVNEVDPQMAMLPEHSTDINAKAQAILRTLQHPRRTKPVITLARQGLDRAEGQIASLLVEDQNNSGLSYSDYLCFAHRQIQNEVRGSVVWAA
ncbi:COPII coat Sec23p-Sfb3p heterodimer component, partial [Spiromyces aspiralis]